MPVLFAGKVKKRWDMNEFKVNTIEVTNPHPPNSIIQHDGEGGLSNDITFIDFCACIMRVLLLAMLLSWLVGTVAYWLAEQNGMGRPTMLEVFKSQALWFSSLRLW